MLNAFSLGQANKLVLSKGTVVYRSLLHKELLSNCLQASTTVLQEQLQEPFCVAHFHVRFAAEATHP